MDDPFLVRSAETVCNLDRVIQRLTDRKRTISESRSQGLTREEFHYGVRDPVCGSDIEDGEDGWMGKRGDRLGFAFEPRKGGRVTRQSRRKNLDGNVALEPSVAGAIDLAHPPNAQRGQDLVRAESSAG
jgi:hypothetical protein